MQNGYDHMDIEDGKNSYDKGTKKKSKNNRHKLGNRTSEKKNEKIKEIFLDYFDAFKNRKENLSSKEEDINKLDFNLISYNEAIENLEKNPKINFILKEEKYFNENENVSNVIDKSELFTIISNLIKSESNVLLYGYGSKLRLIYDYVKYFQENINGKDTDYHVLIFNCYNSDLNIKFILGEIYNFLNDIKKKLIAQNDNDDKANYHGEYEGSCKTVDEQLKKIHFLSDDLFKKEIISHILVVVNNIDSPSLCNYFSQKVFSQLFLDNQKIHLLATSDNLYLNYFWNQTIKDNYSFYFLRFNTFENYDMEINDKNSLTGEKNIKAGMGLIQILKSLTQNQRDMIKIIAKHQLEGNVNNLSLKNLTNLLINETIASSQNQVVEFLLEPKDHHLIVERKGASGTFYKLNLSQEILEKFNSGEYDNLD